MRKHGIFQFGQVIAEVLIALGISAILVIAATGGIAVFLRENYETRTMQAATSLAQEYSDKVKSLAESNWSVIYFPPAAKGPNSTFSLVQAGASYNIVSGGAAVTKEGQEFTQSFSLENVNRDSCGVGNITADSPSVCAMESGAAFVAEDPQTQKITAKVSWGGRSITQAQYVTRSRNKSTVQTDWSGGFGQSSVVVGSTNQFATSTGINYTTSTGSIVVQGF